ncbi:MAG: glutamate--tRNA ligase [Candidatus Cloacimonetes bacterium]|nr:glutamate--tRNA ligase [Candidatus Cloacimonadota bacterium]
METINDIRVRFAPSPTGLLHLGGVRTALFNYLFAKKYNGTFILRIEDTDRTRFDENSVENLISSLCRLGLDYDEGPYKEGDSKPYFQSERLDMYHKHAKQLIDNGQAYYCFCTKDELDDMRKKQEIAKETTKYDGRCKNLSDTEIQAKLEAKIPFVVRMKIPSDTVFDFEDLVRGNVQIASDLVEDQVILKADGFPTYHLAAVIDDHYMRISHVLRGEEWLYSTPKHLFLYQAFGWSPPIWVHLPLLLNTDRSKLSKRHGDFSVSTYLDAGYPKEAVINFVALLGWHSADDRELFSLGELIQEFSLERITKSAAIFDITKLEWMSGWYIRSLPLQEVAHKCRVYFEKEGIDIHDEVKYLKVISRARDQINKLPDITLHAKMFYTETPLNQECSEIVQQDISQKVLTWFVKALQEGEEPMDKEAIQILVSKCSAELGIKGKALYFPLRIALFGDCHGPDIPLLIDLYGKQESLSRLHKHIL